MKKKKSGVAVPFCSLALPTFGVKRSGSSSSLCGTLGWEASLGAWAPCSLGRAFGVVIFLPFSGLLCVGVFTTLDLCPSYLSHSSFFISLVVEKLFF